jgi:hypothetical protein
MIDLIASTKFYVGRLCKNGHEHEGSGGSLRYNSCKMCVQCIKEQRAERAKNGYFRDYYIENRTSILDMKRNKRYWRG